MVFQIISVILAAALVIAICVITEQKAIIRRQGKRLLETLDWIEPDKIVRADWDD
jgi:hypothetical protein